MKEKIIFCWSSGKDSSLALYEILKSKKYEIIALLTTICENTHRVGHHEVSEILVEKQAQSLKIPLEKVYVYTGIDNNEYGTRMKKALLPYKEKGVEKVGFGDIFLEDLKEYRESHLATMEMKALFPLWKQNSAELIKQFINLGFKAVVTSVNFDVLDESFIGRNVDMEFLADLPVNVDPCGENGEFHTFVYDGPIFKNRIEFSLNKDIVKGDCPYCDLIPV